MKIKTLKRFIMDIFKNPASITELKKWYHYYSKKNEKSPLDYKIPWMTFSAIDYLEKNLTKDMNVFEYGSGGSTLFFSQRVNTITSIEHDKGWYDYELNILSKLNNLELKLIVPQLNGRLLNHGKDYENMYFDNYVNSIDDYEDKFDLIIVDGRQRNECFKKAILKVKCGGVIVFDNFDREHYQKSLECVNATDFEILSFYGFVPFGTMQSLTTIFKKNK
jgi:hypothetical protein